MLNIILPLIIGYLLGSVSPAYILGRLLRGKDIRELGDKNAGTTNVFHTLGLRPAIICGIYDLAKGLLSMFVAYKLGSPELIIYLSGYAAILGHVFPFYLGFRGGQGSATGVAILIYFLVKLSLIHLLPFNSLAILAAATLAILAITRQKGLLGFITLPALLVIVLKNYEFSYLTLFTGLLIVQLFAVSTYEAVKNKIFVLHNRTFKQVLVWRTLMRPLGIIFPIANLYLPHALTLWIVGAIAGVFLVFDLIRLLSRPLNFFFFKKAKIIFKKKEERRLSSITLFLIANFVVILLFSKFIALAALAYLVFGDVFAKFFGLEYGQIKIFGDKTLEGSGAFFIACLIAGYLLWLYTGLPPAVILSGAVAATVAEALPLGINDNLSVAILSASAMFIADKLL
jgi:glycerol-3-phosphate acyltransferase PlsY